MRLHCATAAILIALLLTGLFAGCGGNSGAATWLGAAEPAPAPPLAIEVLCDGSRGSTCTESTLSEVLKPALAAAARRPGSTVRMWVQGFDVESTRAVSTVTSSKSRRSGRRAIRDAEERWIAKSSDDILAAIRPHLDHPARRSPIAEAVTRVSMSTAPPDAERWIVVISDGLEVSGFGDFECARLPRSTEFVRSLHHERVLGAASLAAIHVRMCHLDLAPVDGGRCPMTVARAVDVRALWSAAFSAAGASDVQITEGAPALFNEPNNTKENN
jgi:hypothetical protein